MRPCHNAVHSRLADLRGAWLAASTLGRAVRCTGKGSHSQPFMAPPPWMPSRRHGSDRASRLTGTFASGAAEPKAAAADARQAGARRRRLDEVCQELYPQHSRNLLQSWIIQGKVLVNDRVVNKAGHAVPKGATGAAALQVLACVAHTPSPCLLVLLCKANTATFLEAALWALRMEC
jgi:hypothetical protein